MGIFHLMFNGGISGKNFHQTLFTADATVGVREPSPISTAPCDGTLIWLHCRSEAEPIIGYWSKTFIGWVAYHEPIPLIRHDVTGWEPIADQAEARAMPLVKVRQAGATTVVHGEGVASSSRAQLAVGRASRLLLGVAMKARTVPAVHLSS
jgi:hypothetical protein